MARLTNIKLRRSGTSGNVPTTSQLDLGELAINTYDGKLYLKKNVGGTESIVDIGGGGQSAVYKEYVYTATSNQTTFTGSDDNSQTLSYIPDFLQVFLNGVLLENGTDYAATSLTSVVLVNGASAGDILQISTFVKVLGTGDIVTDTFTGNGSTAAYTLSATPDTENNISVFADGVYQEKSTYSLSGNTLTFNANLPSGVTAEVVIGSSNVTLTNIADLNIGGNLTLVDNKKISFGDDGDLEIKHDGNNSFITDVGTGSLYIRSGTTYFQNAGGTKTSIQTNSGGAQTLYHNNSVKFATSSTGISVTGTVNVNDEYSLPSADGSDGQVLKTDGSGTISFGAIPASGSNTQIQFNDGGDLAGDSDFTFDKATNTLQVTNLDVMGTFSKFEDYGSITSAANITIDYGNITTEDRLPTPHDSYTVSEANSLTYLNTGDMIFVSDETGGATMAFYDGTNWRRIQDRAIIST